MFGATKQSGQLAAFPDVCKTPVPSPTGQVIVPIPYPNLASCAMAQDSAEKVYLAGSKALIKKSNFNQSNGDEAGVQGGVASGKNMGKVEYTLGSLEVKIEGDNAMRLTSVSQHNQNNIVGLHAVPSQTKVIILL